MQEMDLISSSDELSECSEITQHSKEQECTLIQQETFDIQNHLIYCLENHFIRLLPAIPKIGESSSQNERLLLMRELIRHSKSFIEKPAKDSPNKENKMIQRLFASSISNEQEDNTDQEEECDEEDQEEEEEQEDDQICQNSIDEISSLTENNGEDMNLNIDEENNNQVVQENNSFEEENCSEYNLQDDQSRTNIEKQDSTEEDNNNDSNTKEEEQSFQNNNNQYQQIQENDFSIENNDNNDNNMENSQQQEVVLENQITPDPFYQQIDDKSNNNFDDDSLDKSDQDDQMSSDEEEEKESFFYDSKYNVNCDHVIFSKRNHPNIDFGYENNEGSLKLEEELFNSFHFQGFDVELNFQMFDNFQNENQEENFQENEEINLEQYSKGQIFD